MKFSCLLFAAILFLSTQAHAQRLVPEDRAKYLQTLLKLSETQTGKITGYYKVLVKQMDSVIAAGGEADDIQQLMLATKGKIKAVLTADQNVGYEKMLRESAKQNDSSTPRMQRDTTAGAAPAPKQN